MKYNINKDTFQMFVERSGRQVIATLRGLCCRLQMLPGDILSLWVGEIWKSVHEFQDDLLNTHKDAKSHSDGE